jgi:hypothetical protein
MLSAPRALWYISHPHLVQPPNPFSGPALNFIQSYATPILSEKLTAYCTDTGRDIEAIIARDDYLSSLSDLQFRNGHLRYPISQPLW